MRKILFLAPFIVATAAFAQQTPRALAHDYVQSIWRSSGAPGVSAAVAVGGRMVYSEGFGYADLENLVPATGATVYDVGSVSKVMTAVAVMQLVERGKIALDDPVTKYVAGLPPQDAPITIRHILTHESGIRHYRGSDFPDDADENMKGYKSFDAAIGIFKNDPLLFKPGQYYFYSSYAVNLLQGVIEKVSGVPFEDYMRANVWSPAGMSSSSFDVPERIVPRRARGYYVLKGVTTNQPFGDLTYKFASGGMMASVDDLARFGVAINHDLLLNAATKAQMFTPVPMVKRFGEDGPIAEFEFAQALIWRVFKDDKGRTFVNHCGTVQGFNACIVDYPAEDVVAVIAGNGYPVNPARREAVALAGYFFP
jgi:serine beta-lactamase-like protein LACTB, mitochondrial